jgi:hypothetical protein
MKGTSTVHAAVRSFNLGTENNDDQKEILFSVLSFDYASLRNTPRIVLLNGPPKRVDFMWMQVI